MSRAREVVAGGRSQRGRQSASRTVRRGACLLICAASFLGCSSARRNAATTSPAEAFVSPSIERLAVVVLGEKESARLTVTRADGLSTVVLERLPRDGRRQAVLDSIGPAQLEPQMVSEMLKSFDLWALNAPNARGAACRTHNGERKCAITSNDYSVVMEVVSRGKVRAQRYTGLEKSESSAVDGRRSARALGDYLLEWARRSEGRGQNP